MNNQNNSGLAGLFPADLIITDTTAAQAAIIRSGAGIINGSNPVGVFSVTHNELAFFELDFSAKPVDYVAFQDIDHSGTTGVVTAGALDGTQITALTAYLRSSRCVPNA